MKEEHADAIKEIAKEMEKKAMTKLNETSRRARKHYALTPSKEKTNLTTYRSFEFFLLQVAGWLLSGANL